MSAAILVSACRVDLAAVGPPAAPAAALETAPTIYPVLYGLGDSDVAQRARMLIWMDRVGFDAAQLRELRKRAIAAVPVAEAPNPALSELAALYAGGRSPSPDEVAAFAPRLSTEPSSPKALQAAYTSFRAWVDGLPTTEQERIPEARFFLGQRFGPLSTPGDHDAWLGPRWASVDFASLDLEGQADPADLGGLWSTPGVESRPGAMAARAAVVLLVAAVEPGFVEAIDVRLGERDVGAYGP